jgi:two-component system sensor kinase FixL
MGELTASLAHEINQPLSAIMSNAQAVRRYLNAPAPDMAEIREILDDIVKENARAGAVIHRLRMLLKKSTVETEPVDLNSIFKEIADLLHSDAVMRNVNLSLELDPLLPLVQGDRIRLQQVAMNLVLNGFDALDHRPREERRLLIQTRRQGTQILASVSDNGKGIAAADAEKLFEPFFTTKPQGLGMGLSICRSIINSHKGHIWAEENPGGGAAFIFVLPVSAARSGP